MGKDGAGDPARDKPKARLGTSQESMVPFVLPFLLRVASRVQTAWLQVNECRREVSTVVLAEQRKPFVGRQPAPVRLPVGEMQLVQEDGIRRLLVIPVHLEVERDAVPSGGSRMLPEVTVDRLGDAIERNRLVEESVSEVRCT